MSADFNSHVRLYALLARLFLEELDRPLALYLRRLPGLAEHIPPDPAVDDCDMRAEHQWLFGLNVYPYEAIFRDRDLMLNTAATSKVVALYEACGFAPAARLRAGAPDHLGVELALMAELTSHLPHDPAARSRIAELLHRHLAAWLPPCSEALARVARAPLYRSRADIAAVGHALALPAPIAEREQMLVALFGAAGPFELVPALLAALGGLLHGADGAYARLAADHPAWGAQGQVWRRRVAAGLALLDDLAREYHDSLNRET